MPNNRQKYSLSFLAWLLVVPFAVSKVYVDFPFEKIDSWFVLLNFIMLIIAMKMSFQLSSVSVSVERWIIFAIFFQYGLFAEMMFMQLTLIISQFFRKSSLPWFYRFTTNSLMFTIVSIVSALAFYLAGGTNAQNSLPDFLAAALVYALTYSLVNSAILFFVFKLEKLPRKTFQKTVLWDLTASLSFLPLAVAYSLLADVLQNASILLIGLPALFVLLTMRNYAFSGELNNKLSAAVEVGHELTESLRTDEVIRVFSEKIRGVIQYDQLYLLDIRKDGHPELLSCLEEGRFSLDAAQFSFNKRILETLPENTIQTFGSVKEVQAIEHLRFSPAVESVMAAPIIRLGKREGILIMTSFRKNFFGRLDKRMTELLTGFFETSLMKAYRYEQTVEQGERCGLTKLHNYRYLTKRLSVEVQRMELQEKGHLSVILLDIDHFKSINDTYGHQSGNDILVAFAGVLTNYRKPGRILARYGGEEFVLVIPGCTKAEAAVLAEEIRKEIEETVFTIVPDLSENREAIDIRLTVSLGVSSMPEDTTKGHSLLRNADRALYIGGKQAGRNRVGIYQKEAGDPVIL